MKIVFVLNGSSLKRMPSDLPARLEGVARAKGHEASHIVTKSLEHMREATAKAVADGAQAIFAGGGDGTLHHICNVPGVEQVVLTPLPIGTVNAWLRSAGVDYKNPIHSLEQLLAGRVADCWMGRLNGMRFACFASIGFDARTIHRTTPERKAALRAAAFGLTGLGEMLRAGSRGRAGDAAFGPGGRESRADSLIVSKIRNYAGINCFHVPADTRGFESIWTRKDSLGSILALMGFVMAKGPSRQAPAPDSIGHQRHVERVIWNGATSPFVQLDGEPVSIDGATDLRIEVETTPQRMFLPLG